MSPRGWLARDYLWLTLKFLQSAGNLCNMRRGFLAALF